MAGAVGTGVGPAPDVDRRRRASPARRGSTCPPRRRTTRQGGTAADTGLLNDQGTDPDAQNFVGYTFSVACSEVEVDILTGEVEIIRADLVYDMGKSINPATDVGQIEGAFMQGVGRVLLEDVVTQMTGPNQGQNNTPNTWGYKIPASTTVPRGDERRPVPPGATRARYPRTRTC